MMKTHIQIVAWIYIAFGILGMLFALLVGALLASGGWLIGDEFATRIFVLVALVGVGMAFLTMIPGIVAGIGLLKFQPWARILAVILGLINLPGFPLGTLLGIYAIWAMLDDETTALFQPGAEVVPPAI